MKNIFWKYTLVLLTLAAVVYCNGDGNETLLPPQIISLDPAANGLAALVDSIIKATFGQNMNSGDASTFVVQGSMSGKLPGTYSGSGSSTLAFDPNNNFKPGEEVEVTLTAGLTSTNRVSLVSPFVYRFLAEVGGTGNSNFVSQGTVMAGGGSRSVTAGDLDGDGDLDLAVANQADNSVTLLLNDGSGSFNEAAGSPVSVGFDPGAVTSGDLDGDGDIDLAVANFFGFDVTVLLNDGSAGFSEAPGSPLPAGNVPFSITTGDLDGDGDLDLAVANENDDNVIILFNDGSAGFSEAPGSPIAVGDEPQSVAAGDLDNDGDLDLAVANFSGDNVTVLLNDGSAGFGEAVGSPVTVDNEPTSVIVGDLDGDSDLDLAVANFSGDNVTVLLNDGGAGFSEAAGSPIAAGNGPFSITRGDLDGDGDLDLATANFAGFIDNATVLLNDGSARFSEAAGSPFVVGSDPFSITTGDLDGDGDLDLAVANIFSNDVTLLQNQP